LKKIKFKKLIIENFRNYEEMSFDFEPNRFCVITGANGSGKTTLAVDAICWCIYDETSKGRKGDSVIRKRSGKNTRVVLSLDIDEDKFIIENNRKHDEYGDIKSITKNGNPISGANRAETNKRIADILMPKDVFKNCLLFSQYINKPFAEMGDTGQKNIFDLMMGFNKFNEYYDKSKTYIKNIESKLLKIREELLLLDQSSRRNKESLDSELVNRDKLIELYEIRKSELEQTIINLTNDNILLKEEVFINVDLVEKHKRKQAVISETSSNIAIIKNKFENDKQLITTNLNANKDKELVEVDKKFRDILTDINTELESINNAYNVLKQEINAKNEALKSKYFKGEHEIEIPIRAELDIVTKERMDALKEFQIIINAIETKVKERDSLLISTKDKEERLNQEIPTCYACKQDIRGFNLEEVRAIYENEKVELKKCIDEIKDFKQRKISINDTICEKDQMINTYNDKRKEELAKLDIWKAEELKRLQEYRDDHLEIFKMRETEVNSEKKFIDIKMSDSIKSLDVKYNEVLINGLVRLKQEFETSTCNLNAKLKDMKMDLTILEEVIERENIVNNKINLNNGTILAKKEELNNMLISSHKEHLDEYNLRIQKLNEIINEDVSKDKLIKDTIEERERKLMISKFWKKAFSPKGIKAILLDESIPILNEKARDLSSKTDCIRVNFSSQKPLKSGEFRNQFCVLPIQTKNLTDEREDFSQGEGRMVDIITLLSLRHLLEVTYDKTFNISLFDETLDSLSRDNAEVVLDFLIKMSEESCTILITHTLRNYIEPDEHLELGR